MNQNMCVTEWWFEVKRRYSQEWSGSLKGAVVVKIVWFIASFFVWQMRIVSNCLMDGHESQGMRVMHMSMFPYIRAVLLEDEWEKMRWNQKDEEDSVMMPGNYDGAVSWHKDISKWESLFLYLMINGKKHSPSHFCTSMNRKTSRLDEEHLSPHHPHDEHHHQATWFLILVLSLSLSFTPHLQDSFIWVNKTKIHVQGSQGECSCSSGRNE